MIRRIFKYSRVVFAFLLIVSVVLPSYASISSADGSSFVTKAEFDSALAEFNSRLTTFEAGINSKIDSQVTSYLDRNGIWSAKVCTFLGKDGATGYDFVRNSDISSVNPTWNSAASTFSVGQFKSGSMLSKYYTEPNFSTYNISTPLCWQCDKSGLFYGAVFLGDVYTIYNYTYYTGYHMNYYYGFNLGYSWYKYTASSQINGCTYDSTNGYYKGTLMADDNLKADVVIGTFYIRSNASTTLTSDVKAMVEYNSVSEFPLKSLTISAGNYINTFFVAKNEKLALIFRGKWLDNGTSGPVSWTTGRSGCVPSKVVAAVY